MNRMEFKFIDVDTGKDNVTPEYIAQLEKELGIRFPEVLAEFYQHHNMALLKEFPLCIGGVGYDLNYICSLRYGMGSLERQLQFDRADGYLPETYIPLACEFGGDRFYWDAESGAVYHVSGATVEHPSFVCNSVDEFFDLLENACN